MLKIASFQKILIVMWWIVVNNAIVVQDLSEIHTQVVKSHQDQYANQIHVHQMVNVSFKKMANQFASVHLEWVEIQQQPVAMDMNVMQMVIVPIIMLAWASDVAIHVLAHVALEQVVK